MIRRLVLKKKNDGKGFENKGTKQDSSTTQFMQQIDGPTLTRKGLVQCARKSINRELDGSMEGIETHGMGPKALQESNRCRSVLEGT